MFVGYTNYHLIRRFKRTAKKSGLRDASKDVLQSLGTSIQINGSFLPSGPQLIIANHTTLLDLFKVYAVIPRDDVYIVAFALNSILGEQMRKKLLPVYLSHKPNNNFFEWLRVQYWIPRQRNITPEHARERNRETIFQASLRLREGHTVIIFPSGFNWFHTTTWQDGIGYLLLHLKDINIPIVPVRLYGNPVSDIIRYSNFGIFSPLLPHRTTTVDIGAPFYSQSLLSRKPNGKVMTQLIHEAYDKALINS